MLLLAAIVAQVAAPFAPPLGVPIRIVTERTQGEGAGRFTVHIERLVRFARDGIGYRAEVRLVEADSGPRADTGEMLQAGFAGLAGRTITVRLDNAGKVVAVDDREALWERFCAAIAAIVAAKHGVPAERARLAERMVGTLRALPPERQQGVLGSLVSALIAEGAAAGPGTRPVRLPGSSPFGGKVELAGTRSVASAGPLTHSATHAAADVPGQDGTSAHIELDIDQDADPRTGLLAAQTETLRTTIGAGPAARTTDRISTVRVTLEPAGSWTG